MQRALNRRSFLQRTAATAALLSTRPAWPADPPPRKASDDEILAQTAGQRRTSVNRAAFLFALEPVMAALFAWIARGEVLTGREMIGGAMLVAAAIVADRPLERRRVCLDRTAGR